MWQRKMQEKQDPKRQHSDITKYQEKLKVAEKTNESRAGGNRNLR